MSSKAKQMTATQVERAAALFSSLAEPSRLRLLQALMGGELTVTELVDATGLSQANVSKHLAGLHAARLVARTRDGVFMRYKIGDPIVQELCALVCSKIERDVKQELKSLQG